MMCRPDGEKASDDAFSRFDAIPACDGQTPYNSIVRVVRTHRALKRCFGVRAVLWSLVVD